MFIVFNNIELNRYGFVMEIIYINDVWSKFMNSFKDIFFMEFIL